MEFLILGPLRVLVEGRTLPLGGPKQGSTLALLLLGRNRVVSRDHLVDGLWGASPPPSAGATLETYVSRLRRVLRDEGDDARLVTQSPGYRLRVEPGEFDLERFETLLDDSKKARAAGDPQRAGKDLRDALALFRGEPLEDLAHVPFAAEEIRRLDELRLAALEQRLDADLAVGRHAELVGELESLTARNPFRETLRAQLMLALYRSGRQGEALIAFDRARRALAEELGVDPGQALKQLHSQILRQAPSLEYAVPSPAPAGSSTSVTTTSPPTPGDESETAPSSAKPAMAAELSTASTSAQRALNRRPFPRRRPALVGAALAVVVALAAFLISRAPGDGGDTPRSRSGTIIGSRPGTVLIDLDTGEQITSISLSRLAVSAYPVFSEGHFWVHNFEPNSYVEIDPETGEILRQLNTPAWPVDVPQDSATLTPFDVEGNDLWVGSGHDLVKLDIDLGRVVERFHLDDYVGGGSGITEGVAIGGGSIWVSRDVGRGQIVRLDPATGTVQHRFDDMSPHLQLAYGDGSLWAADQSGIARIDAETNRITRTRGINGNTWVAAGGGFGWTSDRKKGVVYRVDETGHLIDTYTTGLGASFMAYTDGVLWVANRDEGSVTGIDALTGQVTRYQFDHPTETMTAGGGVLLVFAVPGQTGEALIDSIPGTVAKFFSDAGQLGQGDEPALNTHPGAIQVDHATCAMLLDYQPGPQGWQLQPEVAATMPAVSTDRRTYTFTVRSGYKFSPPSNQPVTARTFRYSVERALSPKLAQNPTGQTPPGPLYINDIEGERAFRSGRARHISGLQASGDQLSITLTKPSPDFLARLSLPFFCPVPIGTPFVAGAPSTERDQGATRTIPGTGPYYVAGYANEQHVILKRNPNYGGSRPQTFESIAILEGVGASIALDRIEQRGWDGITTLSDPLLDIGGEVDRQWGPKSAAAARGDQRFFTTPLPRTRLVAFNASREVFADHRVRRAAALALDRDALAAAWKQVPTDQILSPVMPGFRDLDLYSLYSLEASRGEARSLDARRRVALMAIPPGCGECSRAAEVIATNLATIGIDVKIKKVDFSRRDSKLKSFDLIDFETGIPYPDSASFLSQLVRDIPSGWLPADVRAQVHQVAVLSGNRRQTAAVTLADHLATNEVPVAAFATPQTTQFVGPQIGCRSFNPFGYGLELAALCLKAPSD